MQDELEAKYAVHLVSKARDAKGRGKALDEWHCHPVRRGRADKQDKDGSDYTILGSLPPSRTLCSNCWRVVTGKASAKPGTSRTKCTNQRLWCCNQRRKSGVEVLVVVIVSIVVPFWVRIVNIDLVKPKKNYNGDYR